MLVTLLGIVMLVRPVQPVNAELPMLVTLLGIVILVRQEQPVNASLPMLVTLYILPLYVTLSGITTLPVYSLEYPGFVTATVLFVASVML